MTQDIPQGARCKGCVFAKETPRQVFLKCHRSPPLANYEWPLVNPNDVCGEFKGREP